MKSFWPGSLALAAVFLSSACGPTKPSSPEEYLRLGNQAMEDEVYGLAADHYQALLEEFPFSDYTEEAQLKAAEALFRDKRYPEAIAAFEDFQRMHPTNPNLAFAEYHIGLSYMEQMGKVDRDQQASANAHRHFQRVLDRYPASPWSTKARAELAECRDALAEHELHVAKFYLHWENPAGADSRLRYLLENYIDTDTSARGLLDFGRAFRERGDLSRAALAFASLIESHPKSAYVADARDELARLRSKEVPVPEEPLHALLETLGRTAAPTPAEDEVVPGAPSPEDLPEPSGQDYS